jgi:hypothetical protein
MAITTVNEKLAIMEWCSVWEPGLPISPSTIGQDDQQQLLNDYPGVLWGALVNLGNTILDLNTRIAVYLRAYYSLPGADSTSLIQRYLRELSGDYTARFKRLIEDATA